MVKRVDLVEEIREAARRRGLHLDLRRHGGDHDIYDLDGMHISIPRHREVGPRLALAIRVQCEAKLGSRWWR